VAALHAWELAARLEIADLGGRYANSVDRGDVDGFVALFAGDGVLEIPSGDRFRGAGQIASYLAAAKQAFVAVGDAAARLHHHTASAQIRFEDEARAVGRSYFLALGVAGPDHWGVYRDRFVLVEDRWLFGERIVRIGGNAPGGWMARVLGSEVDAG
jgi:hypothetical protein